MPVKKITKQNKPILQRRGIPRILRLKIIYGDDFIDYIKDDYGVEKFLRDIFRGRNAKGVFLKNNRKVKEFVANWIVFTEYYKERFGKNIRDKDAVDKLFQEQNFKGLKRLYSFRCELFKADFSLDKDFYTRLDKYLVLLRKINRTILQAQRKRERYLIKNNEW